MTAAAEDHPPPRPAVRRDRRAHRGRLLAALTAASLACGSACTADAVGVGGTVQPGLINTEPSEVAEADERAIRGTIEALNSSASNGIAGQQAALASLVEPTLTQALADCAPTTTTLRLEPIYPGLRPSPGWLSSNGPLSGTVYALPTLIRIYTGDRITGTDLTTLHFGVQAGEAYLTPLCVG